MIAVIIGLVLLGFMLAVPFSFFAFTRITKAKKEAKAILEKGKIDDIKKVEVTLKLLNALKDTESTHLWNELNKLYEQHRKAS